MEEDDKNKGFKVEDRRRFSAEGELKAEHRVEGEVRAEERTAAGKSQSSEAPGAAERPSGPAPEINFSTFVVSLSTQALLLLGEIPNPMTNNPERDLPGAQQIIDILGMLREKTRGNLDHDEEGLVDSILFDLRMKYVEITRRTASN